MRETARLSAPPPLTLTLSRRERELIRVSLSVFVKIPLHLLVWTRYVRHRSEVSVTAINPVRTSARVPFDGTDTR
jgi:hypothetical protein